jgi:hypothetical protein
LLTNKKEVRPSSKAGVRLDKLPDRTMMTNKNEFTEDLPQLKNVKLTKEEQIFIKEYRRLEELEREKGIKFF